MMEILKVSDDVNMQEAYELIKTRYKDLYTNDFIENFCKLQEFQFNLVLGAKIYILENIDKVKNWDDLFLCITDNTPIENDENKENYGTVYFSNTDMTYIFSDNEVHTSIESITNVILDYDGDFSLTINGKDYWWLDDQPVIDIAMYIEKYLTKKNN